MKKLWQDMLELGIRSVGTKGNLKAGEFIYNELSKYTDEISWEPFEFQGWHSECESTSIGINSGGKERTLQSWAFMGSGMGPFEGTIKKIGKSHVWNMYLWDRYAVINDGRVLGYIIGRENGGALSQTLIDGNSSIPNVIISDEDSRWLSRELEAFDEVSCWGEVKCEQRAMEGRNILGRFSPPGSHGKKRVIVCAHYDSMYNTVGAYDNAAGVVVLLELARRLKEHTLRPVDIIFMDGEEWALAGSKYMAGKTKPDEIEYVLNIDGVGSCDEMEIWCGGQEFEKKIIELVLANSEIADYCFINPPKRGSDHVPYNDMGIDCVMYTFNEQDVIHTPRDIFNNKTVGNMEKMLRLCWSTLQQIQS